MQYIKIKEAIVEQIDSGMLTPRQKLPAERKLAEMFDTTRVTLREALSLLEAEGRIYREDRRGWFISPKPLRFDPSHALNFSSMAKNQGRSPKTEILTAQAILANKEAGTLLTLAPFSDVYCVERVRYLEERPVVYIKSYIRPEFFPNLLEHDLSHSLTDIYHQEYATHYQKSHYRIGSTSLVGDIAQALRATSGTPAMLIERINHNQDGQPIDCHIEYWHHDAISIESVVEFS